MRRYALALLVCLSVVFIISLSCCFTQIQEADVDETNATFTISTDKQVYYLDETILVTLELKNIDSKSHYYEDFHYDMNTRIKIIDENGTNWGSLVQADGPLEIKKIKPKQTVTDEYSFNIKNWKVPPGEYTIIAYYHKFTSNEVKISIIE